MEQICNQNVGNAAAAPRLRGVSIASVTASLKERVNRRSREAGFYTTAEGVRTILRDFSEGKIQYTDGILKSQP